MGIKSTAKKRFDNYLRRKLFLHKDNWDIAAKYIPAVTASFKKLTHPVYGKLLRKITGFEGKGRYTQSYIVPINRKVDYQSKNVIIPIDKIRQIIKISNFRAIMNSCICRDGCSCKNYPHNIGCLQLGEGSRNMTRRGIAHEATEEEALAHLENAAELGLVAICAWVEMEALILGVPEEDHEKYLEICLCCPCCCMGMRSFKATFHNETLKGRFNTTGWRARGVEECVGCEKCAKICPMEAITMNGGNITISDKCIGCGLCATKCPKDAIVMDEITPMKDQIQDYFWGLDLRLDG